MSINTVLPIAALVQMSHTFETMELQFAPEKFQLSHYEQDVIPALVARLVDGLGIERARPRWRLGHVASFDVIPFARADPAVIVCAKMDLQKYYEMWGLMMRADHWRLRDMFVEYDVAMQIAIRSARELTQEEIYFAICEMLHFRNAMMGRAML